MRKTLFVTFRLVSIGEVFSCNGNTYVKRSTRTALLLNVPHTFYFSQYETCEV